MHQKRNNWHFGGGLAENLRGNDPRSQEVFEDSSKGFGWDMHKIFENMLERGQIEKKKINNCCYFKLI